MWNAGRRPCAARTPCGRWHACLAKATGFQETYSRVPKRLFSRFALLCSPPQEQAYGNLMELNGAVFEERWLTINDA